MLRSALEGEEVDFVALAQLVLDVVRIGGHRNHPLPPRPFPPVTGTNPDARASHKGGLALWRHQRDKRRTDNAATLGTLLRAQGWFANAGRSEEALEVQMHVKAEGWGNIATAPRDTMAMIVAERIVGIR